MTLCKPGRPVGLLPGFTAYHAETREGDNSGMRGLVVAVRHDNTSSLVAKGHCGLFVRVYTWAGEFLVGSVYIPTGSQRRGEARGDSGPEQYSGAFSNFASPGGDLFNTPDTRNLLTLHECPVQPCWTGHLARTQVKADTLPCVQTSAANFMSDFATDHT